MPRHMKAAGGNKQTGTAVALTTLAEVLYFRSKVGSLVVNHAYRQEARETVQA